MLHSSKCVGRLLMQRNQLLNHKHYFNNSAALSSRAVDFSVLNFNNSSERVKFSANHEEAANSCPPALPEKLHHAVPKYTPPPSLVTKPLWANPRLRKRAIELEVFMKNIQNSIRHKRCFSTTKEISVTPTLEKADSMSLSYSSMDNSSLVTLSKLNDYCATSEVLKRHVMSIDRVSYAEANDIFRNVREFDCKNKSFHALPYRLGIFVSVGAGLGSFPMCFDIDIVHWFNTAYVTADVPEQKDLETWLEVGSWSWNWMEPPLGQVSFLLLCLTYARSQLQNLGKKPFTAYLRNKRAESLAEEFPMYDRDMLMQFSLSDSLS
mmetsp:Transcript_42712/g.49937  ORF Transcript_42712/g.49937 Transcript_42712/m.49937 type:complete len:322 (+) Transcript_42712:54-1019(+)